MLKIGKLEKKILDGLLTKKPRVVAQDLELDVSQVNSAKYYFRRKVQNARDFLAVANSKYRELLSSRLKTPSIMPEEDEDFGE
jgi:hypothetical protein